MPRTSFITTSRHRQKSVLSLHHLSRHHTTTIITGQGQDEIAGEKRETEKERRRIPEEAPILLVKLRLALSLSCLGYYSRNLRFKCQPNTIGAKDTFGDQRVGAGKWGVEQVAVQHNATAHAKYVDGDKHMTLYSLHYVHDTIHITLYGGGASREFVQRDETLKVM